jgi:serine/threonine-protein kinase
VPLAPGTRLGAYEILSLIGSGGMGEVYRARDSRLNREVAIKVLPADVAADHDRLARFEREAQVLASLNHPNIAQIHGVDDSSGTPALVMELVEGPTLADRIAKGPIPLDETLPIAKQIAEALEAAHEQGIIHRDLKPANIKVRPDGTVKVLDFGLAKALESPSVAKPGVTQSPTLTFAGTQVGLILGTAAYMAPEQIKGRPADQRSDLWALGCVLYEMLSACRAFAGDEVAETLAYVITKQPDWRALPSETPASIHRLLRRCLDKERRHRLANASDAWLEIEDATASPAQQTPVGTSPRRLAPIVPLTAVVTAAVFTVVGVAGLRKLQRSPAQAAVRFAMPVFAVNPGSFMSQGRQALAVSPDGSQIVYSANTRLYRRRLSEFESRPIVGSDVNGAQNPVFSPDGRYVAFVGGVDRIVRKLPVDGGSAITLASVPGLAYGISWDGDMLLIGQGSNGIMRIPTAGGTADRIVTVKADEAAYGPQRVPGTEWILFTLANEISPAGWDSARIVAESVRSHERRLILGGASDARLLPTGHLVYARGGIVFAASFDPKSLALTGPGAPVIEGVLRASNGGVTAAAHWSASQTGVLAYVPGPATNAEGLDLGIGTNDQDMKRLGLPDGNYAAPRVSPDGRLVAYTAENNNATDVWIYDLTHATAPRRLTFGGRNRFPVWSTDGQRIAFQSDREGDAGIFWQRADGGIVERLTKAETGTVQVPESFSPRDERLVYRIEKGESITLWTLSLNNRKSDRFGGIESIAQPTEAVFSPDGRWVAYVTQEHGSRIAIYAQPYPATGAKYQIPTTMPGDGSTRHPVWSRDGSALFYSSGAGLLATVHVTAGSTLGFGTPTVAPPTSTRIGNARLRNFDLMPDGRTIVSVVNSSGGQTPPALAQIDVVLNWFDELKARVPPN